jgi:aspartate/methionine/tyrosine aminotransferase
MMEFAPPMEDPDACDFLAGNPEFPALFYLLVKSPFEDELAFARLLARDKVLVLPGGAFEMPGNFRISLTGTEEMFDRALPVFERAVRAG